MKGAVFAVLALLALAVVATEARELQESKVKALFSKFNLPKLPTLPKKEIVVKVPVPVLPAKLEETRVILTAIFMKARRQIEPVLKNGGVVVVDAAIANALFGKAMSTSAATAKNTVGPAKALSDAVSQAVWGDAKVGACAARACAGGQDAL